MEAALAAADLEEVTEVASAADIMVASEVGITIITIIITDHITEAGSSALATTDMEAEAVSAAS